MQCETTDELKAPVYHQANQQSIKNVQNTRTRRTGLLTVTEKPPGIYHVTVISFSSL